MGKKYDSWTSACYETQEARELKSGTVNPWTGQERVLAGRFHTLAPEGPTSLSSRRENERFWDDSGCGLALYK